MKRWTKGILEVDEINLKKIQSSALVQEKNSLSPGEVLIQTDFAENYSIKYATEVMEKHWTSVPGVVILTAVVCAISLMQFVLTLEQIQH